LRQFNFRGDADMTAMVSCSDNEAGISGICFNLNFCGISANSSSILVMAYRRLHLFDIIRSLGAVIHL